MILYEDHYIRGREPGEIMRHFRQGLSVGGRVRDIQEIKGAVPAIEAALSMAQPGDLLFVQADTVDETVDFMKERLLTPQHAREIVLQDATQEMPELPSQSNSHRTDAGQLVGAALGASSMTNGVQVTHSTPSHHGLNGNSTMVVD